MKISNYENQLIVLEGLKLGGGGGGRVLLSLILDEDVPFWLKNWTHNSANMMKIIPIIP